MKNKLIVLTVAIAAAAGIASAGIFDTPYIAGDFNGWDPASTPMTDLGGGIWEYTITTGANAYEQFKITPGDWSTTQPSANSWYTADGAGEVTITFNTNIVSDGWLPEQYRVGVSTEPGSWSLVGDYNGWNNADPTQEMSSLGGGIYAITQTFAAGSAYLLKPVKTGSWDGIGLDGRSIDAWNYWLDLSSEASDAEVTVYVDAFAGTMKVEVIPEPATIGLLGMAGMGLLLARRKFKV